MTRKEFEEIVARPVTAEAFEIMANNRRFRPTLDWPDPTDEMFDHPELSKRFDAIWEVIKDWDINVPRAYQGYCGATGNHVRAILDGIDRE